MIRDGARCRLVVCGHGGQRNIASKAFRLAYTKLFVQ